MLEPYPTFDSGEENKKAEEELVWLQEVITTIRTIRSEMSVPPGKKIPIILNKGTPSDKTFVKDSEIYIKALAKVESISWAKPDEKLTATATDLVDQLEIHIPLKGLIDKDAELSRLNKEIAKLKKEHEKSSKKLDNPNYDKKAPAEIVEKEQLRLKQTQETLKKLEQQQQNIENL